MKKLLLSCLAMILTLWVAISPALAAECESEGFFLNEIDCTKFYRCVSNGGEGFTRYDFDCGPGTVFDEALSTCNHPWAVSPDSKCYQSSSSLILDPLTTALLTKSVTRQEQCGGV